MSVLRPYQRDAVRALHTYFEGKGGNPIVAMATGTGKSHVIAHFTAELCEKQPGSKVLVATHSAELVRQDQEKLVAVWPEEDGDVGVNCAGLKSRDYESQVIVCSIASIHKTVAKFGKVAAFIVDECHRVSAYQDGSKRQSMYPKVIEALRAENPDLRVVGLTATPWRELAGPLTAMDGRIFTDIVYDNSKGRALADLFSQGYLVPPVSAPTSAAYNVDDVKVGIDGDFAEKELAEAVNDAAANAAIVDEFIEVSKARGRLLVFCVNIEHAEAIVALLREREFDSVDLCHSQRKPAENAAVIEKLRDGALRCVVNVGMLTTGFDCPEIDCIGMMRPTKSVSLWIQMLGRGMRPVYPDGGFDLETKEGRLAAIEASGKADCLVADFGGNTARCGTVLKPKIPGVGVEATSSAKKTCPSCGEQSPSGAKKCKSCGAEFPPCERAIWSKWPVLSNEPMLDLDMGVGGWWKVVSVDYAEHKGARSGKKSMKITYDLARPNADRKTLTIYRCFGHPARSRAYQAACAWWREMSLTEPPTDAHWAVERQGDLLPVSKMKVGRGSGGWEQPVEYRFTRVVENVIDARAGHVGGRFEVAYLISDGPDGLTGWVSAQAAEGGADHAALLAMAGLEAEGDDPPVPSKLAFEKTAVGLPWQLVHVHLGGSWRSRRAPGGGDDS